MNKRLVAEMWEGARQHGLPGDGLLALVDCDRQILSLLHHGYVEKEYRASTSVGGLGNAADSHLTPTGFHEVVERCGDGLPAGAVFRERKFTGVVLPESDWHGASPDDLITSRILRLRGLEPGINSGPGIDSYERCIYLHGTNHEELLGRKASGGCIRLGNRDIIELYDRSAGCALWCWIGEPAL